MTNIPHWILINNTFVCSECCGICETNADSKGQARRFLMQGFYPAKCPYCDVEMDGSILSGKRTWQE